jgi:hypothetical protein
LFILSIYLLYVYLLRKCSNSWTRPSLSKYKRTLMSYTCARISSKTGSGMTTYNSHTATYNTMTPLIIIRRRTYTVQRRKRCKIVTSATPFTVFDSFYHPFLGRNMFCLLYYEWQLIVINCLYYQFICCMFIYCGSAVIHESENGGRHVKFWEGKSFRIWGFGKEKYDN